MEVTKNWVVCWLLAISVVWPFGCSTFLPSLPKDQPPAAPVPRKIEQTPDVQQKQIHQSISPDVQYLKHTITWPGENLIRIARWYTGSGSNWARLVDANPSIEPRRIKIGESILIPEHLLITREPMPKSYLSNRSMPKNDTAVEFDNRSTISKDVELFGPINTSTQENGPTGSRSPLPLESID